MNKIFTKQVVAVLLMYSIGFLMGVITGPYWYQVLHITKTTECIEYGKVGVIDRVPNGYVVTMLDGYKYMQDSAFVVDYTCKTK